MIRLVGYAANQTDRVRYALAAEYRALRLDEAHACDGWGVGSYQTGEVLLRKKPADAKTVRLASVFNDLKTAFAVAHLRSATVGGHTLENTHPFRFRQWVFAHVGTLQGVAARREELLQAVPEFLARNIRGQTDSEVLFHLLLARIHDTGRLDDPEFDRDSLVDAVREGLAQALDLTGDRTPLGFLLGNGHHLLGYRREMPMSCTRRQGLRDPEALRAQHPDILEGEPRRVHLDALRYAFVAIDVKPGEPGWSEVPDGPRGGVAVIDPQLDLHTCAL